MGVDLTSIINNRLLSKDIIKSIPNNGICECDNEYEFTESLSQMYCSNPYCYCKVGNRLYNMCKQLGENSLSAEDCKNICKEFNVKIPFQVFMLNKPEYSNCNSVENFKYKIDRICRSEIRRVKLWEMVKIANCDNISLIAYKLFNGYRTIEEAYDDFERYQVPFVAEKLGIKKSDTGVFAYTIFEDLKRYKSELLYGQTKFEIYNPIGEIINIAVDGTISNFENKSEFIRYINSLYGDKINAILLRTVSSNVDVLIADGDLTNSKAVTAIKINNRAVECGEREVIKIVTSSEYLDILKKRFGKVE